jgi:hypothetical protein
MDSVPPNPDVVSLLIDTRLHWVHASGRLVDPPTFDGAPLSAEQAELLASATVADVAAAADLMEAQLEVDRATIPATARAAHLLRPYMEGTGRTVAEALDLMPAHLRAAAEQAVAEAWPSGYVEVPKGRGR